MEIINRSLNVIIKNQSLIFSKMKKMGRMMIEGKKEEPLQ
jgi:hypothetical protein